MTTAAYVAKITAGGSDFSIEIEHESHSWRLEPGFHAPMQSWLVPTDVADGVMAAISGSTGAAREVTLELGDPGSPITITRVVVIGTAAADNPQRRYLVFSDVRWYFTRAWIALDVNVRRRVGDTHLVGEGNLVSASVADTIAYAPWAINNGSAYDWDSFRLQIQSYLSGARHGRPALSFVFDSFSVLTVSSKIVEETSIDSPGYVGLARAIESVPGASIYVALDGDIHVYESTPSAETAIALSLPPALMGHGDLCLIDNSSLRPVDHATSYRVYVDYEYEVRFTYNASGTGLWAENTASDPFLIPVLEVTDQSLAIPSKSGGYYGQLGVSAPARTVGQGSWIGQDEAFAAWGTKTIGTTSTITLPELTDDIVARHWCGDGLQEYAAGETDDDYDPTWGNRIDELMRCYRTYFRVNPRFWDRIRHAWAIRAAVWDTVTGQRAPATVYQNFNKIPVNNHTSAQTILYGQNDLSSYPTSGLLADGHPTAFRVKIVDRELGIIAIDRNDLSKYPGTAKIIHSPVKAATAAAFADGIHDGPTQELISATSDGSSSWMLAVVMSVAPACPNDYRRMYEIQVSATDAASAISLAVTPTGYGPDKELRSHLSQARMPWLDSTATETLTRLGSSDSTIGIKDDQEAVSNNDVTDLVPVNLNQELIPLAKAVAGVEIVAKLDRYQGTLAVPMDGTLHPKGSINSVTHRVTKNRAVTVVSAEGHTDYLRAVDFLEGSARAFLLQEIPAGQR